MIPPVPKSSLGNSSQPAPETVSNKPLHFLNRIPSLDVLRGIAVLGALLVSIWMFGGFTPNRQNGLLLQSKGWDYRLFGTVDLLLNGKMRALIALVFGAGMLLFLFKDHQKSNVPAMDIFIRRQLWLIFFGLVNALLLLWTGDVLFHLGIMGLLLIPFVRLSARGLLIAAVITTFIYSGKIYWQYADDQKAYNKHLAVVALEKKMSKDSLAKAKMGTATTAQKKDTLTKQQKQDKAAWEGIVNNMKYDSKKDEGQTKAMRGASYWKIWNHLLPTIQSREAQWTYQLGVWDFASLIFLGMALFKMGFFTSHFSAKNYILISAAALLAGLLLGWFRLHFNQLALQDYTKYIRGHWFHFQLLFPFERAFLALGYVSLVIFMLEKGWLRFLWKAFASVGRMALTNYLAQSIICTVFFTGFGMGYFGRLTQVQLYFLVAEIALVQTVFSILWLRYYYYGPAEWLWRCLAHGKRLPNKIKPEIAEPTLPVLS